VNPKPHPNRDRYIRILQEMSPEERVNKAFELSALTKETLKEGLRARFPLLSEAELHAMFLERLRRCHNKNY
jgi:hypothetical protein